MGMGFRYIPENGNNLKQLRGEYTFMELLRTHIGNPESVLNVNSHSVDLALRGSGSAEGRISCFPCDISDDSRLVMADGKETADKVEGFLATAKKELGITYTRMGGANDRFFKINLNDFRRVDSPPGS